MTRDDRPSGIRRLFSLPRRSAGIEREIDDELRFHVDTRAAELVASGLAPAAARARATAEFGDLAASRAELARVDRNRLTHERRAGALEGLRADVGFAARVLRKAPSFTIVAVLTIALGIGANTGVFAVVYGALLRPLPFGDADRIASLSFQANTSVSKERLELLRERQRSFGAVAGYSRWGAALTGGGTAELLRGAVGTANLFDVLQARPALGRVFRPGDDLPGADPIVILGHGLWVSRFGGDSGVVGRPITLDGRQAIVVGVMPAEFDFPVRGTQFWRPTVFDPSNANDYTAGYLLLVGRLRPGTSFTAAQADLKRVVAELRASNLGDFTEKDEAGAMTVPVRDTLVGSVGPRLELLLAAALLVLLMACANVASLTLARGVARDREFAVRTSMGATRSRLIRQLLTESAILALAGGSVGVAVGWGVRTALGGLVPAGVIGADAPVGSWPVVAFTLAASVLAGAAFGIIPALRASRRHPADSLRGSRSSTGRAAGRLMRSFIIGECAIAFVLAVAAGLLLRSFQLLNAEDPGFATDGVLSMRVEAPAAAYGTDDAQRTMLDAVLTRLQATPGVVSAGAIHLLPLGDGNWNPSMVIEGRTLATGARWPEIDWRLVTPGYLTTMRIPLIRGRWFTDADRDGATLVSVINEETARRDFAGTDPIGQRVRTFFEGKGNWTTIVGVVGNTKDQSLAGPARPQLYRPFAQHPSSGMAVLARAAGDPSALARQARAAVAAVDPNIAVDDVRPLASVVAASVGQPRLVTLVFGLFGLLAALLGTVGIYGVVAYTVSLRTAEFGLRVALGAVSGQIGRLVFRDALVLAGTGVGIGVVASVALARFLQDQLYDMRALSPLAFVLGAVFLAAIAAISAIVPARRAVAVDPTEAIRSG